MIKVQPNENRCGRTEEVHELELPECCPVSHNPRTGSRVRIEYAPAESFLEVYSLHKYINTFVGGRGEVRSMEGMIQTIAQDCADVLGVPVKAIATLILHPPQKMTLTCLAQPCTNSASTR